MCIIAQLQSLRSDGFKTHRYGGRTRFRNTSERRSNRFEQVLLCLPFGFKKLFGSEPNGEWPLFEAAEIAKFTPNEKTCYEESLKYYRDLKNIILPSKIKHPTLKIQN